MEQIDIMFLSLVKITSVLSRKQCMRDTRNLIDHVVTVIQIVTRTVFCCYYKYFHGIY